MSKYFRDATLAIKLHREKKPFLAKGSYLIPITSWETGKVQINSWMKILGEKRKDRLIKFITLVKISDNHPICIYPDWVHKMLIGIEFKPLREISQKTKKELMEWYGNSPGPRWFLPELILGEKLPSSCVKWKKDIRLLYGRDSRKKTSGKTS